MRSPDPEPRELLARLAEQPGGTRLLALARPEAYLVGGAVRDLMLGRAPRELDVVVEGENAARALIAALAAAAPDRYGTSGAAAAAPVEATGAETSSVVATSAAATGEVRSRPVEHPRFGTARVELPDGARVDVALARRERYPAPGALPEVQPASLEQDLLRRDFTVNTLALALAPDAARDALRAAPHALQDLREGRLRVLHERSFRDDPTRLLRLARYQARLHFEVEERTAALAADAVVCGALDTVSGARVGAELRLALAEPDPLVALRALDQLGVLRALHPRLRLQEPLLRRALELLAFAGPNGRPELLLLAGIALPLALRAGEDRRLEIAALLNRLEFVASERDRVATAAGAALELVEALPAAGAPAELWELAAPVPLEGVALAGALDRAAAAPARRWLAELCHVRLRIGGEDLLVAGVPEGPEIGRRLRAALRARLNGELPDEREAQLRAALRA